MKEKIWRCIKTRTCKWIFVLFFVWKKGVIVIKSKNWLQIIEQVLGNLFALLWEWYCEFTKPSKFHFRSFSLMDDIVFCFVAKRN